MNTCASTPTTGPDGTPGGFLQVVAAVIVNLRGEVLIARRPNHVHQGGLWEFPGGKIEPGEDRSQALRRELCEELGIDVSSARPLIRIPHAYPDRRVVLDVWRVDGYRGKPHGREGQPIRWVPADSLPDYDFPAANLPIVTAARLPSVYLITPDPGTSHLWPSFLGRLEFCLAAGVRLVQFRAKSLAVGAFCELAEQVIGRCRRHGARVLLNGPPALAGALGADGVHLSGAALSAIAERPLGRGAWVAASCHDAAELAHAERIGVDFVVVSPVQPTASHPEAEPLGWEGLRRLAESSCRPVYALGGVGPDDRREAWEHGAQGIAAIRGIWGAPERASSPAEGR